MPENRTVVARNWVVCAGFHERQRLPGIRCDNRLYMLGGMRRLEGIVGYSKEEAPARKAGAL